MHSTKEREKTLGSNSCGGQGVRRQLWQKNLKRFFDEFLLLNKQGEKSAFLALLLLSFHPSSKRWQLS